MEVPPKIKNKLPHDPAIPFLDIFVKETKSLYQKKKKKIAASLMLFATLLKITKTCKIIFLWIQKAIW